MENRLSKEQILELMDQVRPVPQEMRTEDAVELVRIAATNVAIWRVEAEVQLEIVTSYIEDIDQHLTEVYHDSTSECWARRAEAISVQKYLEDKLARLLQLAVAVIQWLSNAPVN